jgi:hypothetical protein
MNAPLDERQKALLHREFARCTPWLASALTAIPGTHSMDDIRQACEDGTMQLWPGANSVLLTEIIQYPHRKGCYVRALGGDSVDGNEVGARVASWAQTIGCDHVMTQGRPKWIRDIGEEKVSTLTVADLKPAKETN